MRPHPLLASPIPSFTHSWNISIFRPMCQYGAFFGHPVVLRTAPQYAESKLWVLHAGRDTVTADCPLASPLAQTELKENDE